MSQVRVRQAITPLILEQAGPDVSAVNENFIQCITISSLRGSPQWAVPTVVWVQSSHFLLLLRH